MKIMSLGVYYKPECIIGHKQVESDASEQQKFYEELGVEDDGQAWGKCIYYNLELMQESLDFINVLVWITIIVQCLLDVLCYKYRHLAKYYIYNHFAHLIVTRMLPNTQMEVYSTQPIQMVFVYAAYTAAFYCD